jgi:hypothetical protein
LGPRRLAHLKAREYVHYKYLTQEQFDEYFKFCVVRNPWDRVVSTYKALGWDRHVEFKKFLKKLKTELWRKNYWFVGPQSDFVCNDTGDIVVNFLGKFETLRTDFDQICQRLGLPVVELPHINQSKQEQRKSTLHPKRLFRSARWAIENMAMPSFRRIPSFSNYRDYYDDESRELVAHLYRRDLELFGYKFNEITRTPVAANQCNLHRPV